MPVKGKRPPKVWFRGMVNQVKSYASDPEGLVGWIWYNWLSPKKRTEIRRREYGMGKSARYDPKDKYIEEYGYSRKDRDRWISATVNKIYTDHENEGIEGLDRGSIVILIADGTWYLIKK